MHDCGEINATPHSLVGWKKKKKRSYTCNTAISLAWAINIARILAMLSIRYQGVSACVFKI